MPSPSERFSKLWSIIGAVGSPQAPFAELRSRYAEPWRAYHTLAHIESMFVELEPFRGSGEAQFVNFEVVEMAIWYHDVVYNTYAKDNEEKSAELFRVVAECSCLAEDFTKKVIQAILATKHTGASNDFDLRVVCDIDLSIFGQPEAVFDEYERRIRREYEWVPEGKFRVGRRAILQAFRESPSIYSTEFFQKKYEERARDNLLRSLLRLS